MANNEIFTRIQLKYDSYSAWTTNNPTLLPGEVAIAKVVNDVTIPVDEQKNAPVLFKVGPGKFNDLPWVSGLAADVYAWAKQADIAVTGDGNAITTAGIVNDKLTFTKGATFATKAELDAAIEAFGGDLSAITDNDHVYTFALPTEGNDAGKLVVTETIYVNGKAGTTETKTFDFITPTELETILGNYYTKTDLNGKIHTEAEIKAMEIAHATAAGKVDTAITVKVGGADVVFDGSEAKTADVDSAIAAAEQRAKDYAAGLPHENTAHTHTVGAGLAITGEGGITGDVQYALNVAFELVDKKIKLYDKADSEKKALAELDATQFIADGMLASVTADQANNKLVFEWNTDAGVTKTEVELSSIADIYTGVTNTETATTVKNTNEIEVTLINKGVTEAKLEQNVQDALALARTALQEHQSLENYKTKQTAKNYDGTTAKTVTNVKQNANGEVEVTYADIAFPAAPTASGAATIATIADDVVTLKAGAVLKENHTLANNANADITLAKIAKTGSIYDVAEGHNVSTGTDGVKYLVFNCGSSTTVI